jgi:hypothetical protein
VEPSEPRPSQGNERWSGAKKAFRTSTVVLSLVGTLLFSVAFAITLVGRPWIESAANAYLRKEVERVARRELGAVAERAGSTEAEAKLLSRALGARADEFVERVKKERLEERLTEIVRTALDRLCDIDCEEEERAENAADAGTFSRGILGGTVQMMKSAAAGLEGFVVGKYKELLYGLIRELRIFTGLNAALYALTLGVLYLRRRAIEPVLVPAFVLIVATTISIVVYVTAQDWFWTVLTNSYLGYGYLVVVGVVLAFLVDIVFARATVTTAILHAFARVLGTFTPG